MGKIIKILATICLFLAFTGCGVLKKEKITTTKQTEKTEVKKDSSTSVKVNKAINDEVSTQVEATGDAELDAKVDEILSRLNTSKTSGDNSYRVYYDKELRELKTQMVIAQTKDSISSVNNDSKSEKSLESEISELIKKIVIPWWVYVIAIFLLRKPILGFLAFLYPPLRGITTLKDLLTPPGTDQDKSK